MTDWAAFAGFTGVILAVLLTLAHLSRGIPHADGGDTHFAHDLDSGAAAVDDESGSDSETHVLDSEAESNTADGESESRAADDSHQTTDATEHGPSLASLSPASTPDEEREPRPATDATREEEPTTDEAQKLQRTADEAHGPWPATDVTHKSPSANIPPHMLLANVAVSQGLLGAFLVTSVWYTSVPLSALGLSLSGLPSKLAVGVALGGALYAVNRAGSSVSREFGLVPDESLRDALTPETPTGWALLLLVVLPLIAGFEELLFRGALVGALAVGFDVSPWLMAAVSSVAFGVGHGAQGRLGIVVTGLLGFALAAAFVLTQSLLVVVVAHYLVNALEFVGHDVFGW
ncbi:CPBP family glutamic-type intramembrane protease [Haloferax larsenii]|uniref:Membrane protease YdiL, CAAX protease family n=1 Tax=Haloferax larsenii TaxID=302484 RepID=A0A1H7GUG5_HALLR|nr:CPBP family glutamic-type intramembrane protease [Haloferax larsenii]SEK41674.1 Membrane protease YdiL, CAAX protease family [Haloferax larsenii]